jgi:hypothetical protein
MPPLGYFYLYCVNGMTTGFYRRTSYNHQPPQNRGFPVSWGGGGGGSFRGTVARIRMGPAGSLGLTARSDLPVARVPSGSPGVSWIPCALRSRSPWLLVSGVSPDRRPLFLCPLGPHCSSPVPCGLRPLPLFPPSLRVVVPCGRCARGRCASPMALWCPSAHARMSL